MLASIPACFAESHREPYGESVDIGVYAYSDGADWDPHLRLTIGEKTITLSLSQSEMLETALRVARQSVRPRR